MEFEVRPLTPAEFEEYYAFTVPGYGRERGRSEGWDEARAQSFAKEQTAKILPQGRETPDHSFYSLRTDGKRVGWLWLFHDRSARSLFVYDIYFDETARSRGLGGKAMHWIETEARKLGANRVELHVFGHNTGAQRFYDRHGYRQTSIRMRKDL